MGGLNINFGFGFGIKNYSMNPNLKNQHAFKEVEWIAAYALNILIMHHPVVGTRKCTW